MQGQGWGCVLHRVKIWLLEKSNLRGRLTARSVPHFAHSGGRIISSQLNLGCDTENIMKYATNCALVVGYGTCM
jgi:hypothetical protein